MRTCAACGKKVPKTELLRFVFSESEGSLCDIRQKIQSRGIYFCPDKNCIEKGIKRKVFSRLLKKENAEPSLGFVVSNISEGLNAYAYSLMNLAYKSKSILSGDSSVTNGVSKNRVGLILLAKDAGVSVKKRFLNISEKADIPLIEIEDKKYIAQKLNLTETSVFGIIREGFIEALIGAFRLTSKVKSWC